MAAPGSQMYLAQSPRPPALVGRLCVGRRARVAGPRRGPFGAHRAGERLQRGRLLGPATMTFTLRRGDVPGKAALRVPTFSRL